MYPSERLPSSYYIYLGDRNVKYLFHGERAWHETKILNGNVTLEDGNSLHSLRVTRVAASSCCWSSMFVLMLRHFSLEMTGTNGQYS